VPTEQHGDPPEAETLKKGYYSDSKHFLRAVLEYEISLKKYLR